VHQAMREDSKTSRLAHLSLHKRSSARDEDTLSKPHAVVHEMADTGSPPSHRRDEGGPGAWG
jgi:hypothetical protein